MLKVFVCEDEPQQLNKWVKVINDYLFIQNYDAVFEFATQDPHKMLNYVSNLMENEAALFFLDVDLNCEMNGISLASKIKKMNPNAKIVFITTHAELAYLTFTYKIEAMDYIAKDSEEDAKRRVIECIDVAIQRYLNLSNESMEYIVIKSGDSQIRLQMAEIHFVESSATPHRLIIHLENRQIEFYGRIKNMESLNPSFFRCHQSYVVNIDNIESVNSKLREIYMKDGETCYVSIRYLKGLIKKLDYSK